MHFKCILEEQKYYSEDSNWGIFLVQVLEIKVGEMSIGDRMCIKGKLYDPVIGKQYTIIGELEYSVSWGEQVKIAEAITVNNLSDKDYRGQRYILTKMFPTYVNSMYQTLENPYTALKNKDYVELTKIHGCGLTRATQWIDKFEANYHNHKAYLELARYSMPESLIDRIIKGCGNNLEKAVDIVKNHPYDLTNLKGIGWKTADNIALQSGIDPLGTDRIKTCIRLFLKEQGNNGKSYSTSEEIMEEIIDKIGEDAPDLNIAEALHSLKQDNVITWDKEKTKIGLVWFYNLEIEIAKNLKRLKDAPNKFCYENWKEIIKEKERQQGWNYTEQQMQGIEMVLQNQVCCISGYGGTGKTSIIDGIMTVLSGYRSITVALAGRAASRITEASGQKSMTLHRLLKLSFTSRKTVHNYRDNPLEYEIIVVDEMSMIDGYMYFQLLQAAGTGTKIIFIGDVGQLESIGSCAVAADMLDSPHITSIFLDKIHRQAQKSAIITESIKVRKGQQIIPVDWAGEETRGELRDLVLNCYSDKSNTYHNIVHYYKEELSKAKSIFDVQIIVPCKQGVASVTNLNRAAQEIYNPHGKRKKETIVSKGTNQWILRVGDKVINKLNKYSVETNDGGQTDIYNGNLGIVKDIRNDFILVEFQGIGNVRVPKSHISNIELGYAITCHSAQGSQFNVVIGGIDFSMFMMLNKELLYTMITRASDKFILVAQNKALRYAITKEQIIHRQTYLLETLDDICTEKNILF